MLIVVDDDEDDDDDANDDVDDDYNAFDKVYDDSIAAVANDCDQNHILVLACALASIEGLHQYDIIIDDNTIDNTGPALI